MTGAEGIRAPGARPSSLGTVEFVRSTLSPVCLPGHLAAAVASRAPDHREEVLDFAEGLLDRCYGTTEAACN